MTGPLADRVAAFRDDIGASPASMARLLDMHASVAAPAAVAAPADPTRRVCLTGLGSSRFAADIVAGALRASGLLAWSELASGGGRTAPSPDLTVVAVSASGGTREVLEVVDRHRGVSHVVAVTNRADSPLAAAADEVHLLEAGIEASGVACRTFRATLAVLALLGGIPLDHLREAPAALAARLDHAATWVSAAADALDRAPAVDVLADASIGGIAGQAALMLREGPRLPAHAYETADWLHIGVYLAWPGHAVLRYPGSAADGELDAVLGRRGVAPVDAPRRPPDGDAPGDLVAAAIVASIDAEVLAAELWSRTDATERERRAAE